MQYKGVNAEGTSSLCLVSEIIVFMHLILPMQLHNLIIHQWSNG